MGRIGWRLRVDPARVTYGGVPMLGAVLGIGGTDKVRCFPRETLLDRRLTRTRKPPRGRIGLALLSCVLLPFIGLQAAEAAELIPHRAKYKVGLVAAKSGTGIANIQGLMVSDWDLSCEGWTLDQKMALSIFDTQGRKRVSLVSSVSTWESADGRLYRFSVNNVSPGGKSEKIEGSAELPGGGKAGTAQFSKPERKTLKLPKGTIFPTFHSELVLGAADRAPVIISRKVFDGLSIDSLHEVNAVVGRPIETPSKRPELAGRRSWPLNLAFFKVSSTAAEPDQEISMRIFDNGVGDDILLDFGNFQAKATLDTLEMGKRPVCK